jgi:hypothetical protein
MVFGKILQGSFKIREPKEMEFQLEVLSIVDLVELEA